MMGLDKFKKMKNFLAVLLILTFAVSSLMPVSTFAAAGGTSISQDAAICRDIGMLLGSGGGVTPEYTATTLTRVQAAVIFLRLKGLEADARAFTGTANFADAGKVGWAKPYMAYLKSKPELGWLGDGTNFFPTAAITAQPYYKIMLEALGYKWGVDFEYKDTIAFAAAKGLSKAAGAVPFTVNSLAAATVEALRANVKGISKSLAAVLVDAGKLDKAKAQAAGLYSSAPQVKPLDISSAGALAGRVVEVRLNSAVAQADAAAAALSVKDASGKALAVSSCTLSPYDDKNKTVLVALASDTVPGALYTLTCGSKTAVFYGRPADFRKPEILKVSSDDYNQVRINFNMPVKLDNAGFEIKEKYFSRNALSVTNVEYDGSKTVILKTSDQKGATLYGIAVYGVTSFSGSMMDRDDKNTFTGTGKSSYSLKTTNAKALDYNKAVVEFNTKIDYGTISSAAFSIAEASGTYQAVPVTKAEKPGREDSFSGTDDSAAVSVLLTLGSGMRDSTVYKVSVSGGLKNIYGKNLSLNSTDLTCTFVGIKKPDTPLEYSPNAIYVESSTAVSVSFSRRLDPAAAEDTGNYAIIPAYFGSTPLGISRAKLQDDGKTVRLTVSPMKNILYKLTVVNVKDIYGNKINISESKNVQTYSGQALSGSLQTIEAVARPDGDDTAILVRFDKAVGSNAADVSCYNIDNGIGFPLQAETVGSDAGPDFRRMVKLTIPRTVLGTVYKLTVKGLKNSDEIAVDSDETIQYSFIGRGINPTKSQIIGAVAIDNQTLKVYFDRPVDDRTIKGRIWSGLDAPNNLIPGALGISTDGGGTAVYNLDSKAHRAWKDSKDSEVLVIRFSDVLFNSSHTASPARTFKLIGSSTLVQSDDGANIGEFVYNNDNPVKPQLVSVFAENNMTVTLDFSEPVKVNPSPAGMYIYNDEDGSTRILNNGTAVGINRVVKISDMRCKLVLDRKLTGSCTNVPSNRIVYLYISPSGSDITDLSSFIGLEPNTGRNFRSAGFTVNDSDDGNGTIYPTGIKMPDKRTIEVYYPERMNAADVTNEAKYRLVSNSTGTGDCTQILAVGAAEYDEETYKATLYLTGDIGTLRTSPGNAPLTRYYLAISGTVRNETNTDNVKTDKTAIAALRSGTVLEFAPGIDTPPKPKIVYSTVSDDRSSIEITLDSSVRFPDAVDANASSTFNLQGNLLPAEILDALVMNAQFDGEGAVRAINAGDIVSVSINADHDTITVNLASRLSVGSSGTVSTSGAVQGKIRNRAAMEAPVSGRDAASVLFGVPPSLFQ